MGSGDRLNPVSAVRSWMAWVGDDDGRVMLLIVAELIALVVFAVATR